MRADVKAGWVAALRSGEYLQGKGALRATCPEQDKFCCLGVLCDVVGGTWIGGSPYYKRFQQTGGGEPAKLLLPLELQTDLGISSADQDKLAKMNDSGVLFSEIADWIERTL